MFDVVISLAAIVFLAPLMVVVALAIKLQDGGPVVFAQSRIGRGGAEFRCFKFRSMVVDAQARLNALLESDPAARAEWARDQKLRRDPRITSLGAFLRKSSLDELPQFLNVLMGEMSIVGPRPIIRGEVIRYGRRFSSYCSVRPGITGLWQVSGRNETTYDRRVALDHLFARSNGPMLYIAILLRTVPAVLLRKGSF